MTEMKTFVDIEATLSHYVPLAKELTGKGISLNRMVPLMKAVGNPERRLKIVHVAGTSGKTSTVYYIAALLKAAGKTVGLTVSPHVDSVAERVQINLMPISELEFASAFGEFITIIEAADIRPTYFELLIAFAYWYFERAKVDYAVIETGLGGMVDGTNVANREDKVCVITDIGFDHMQILGNTLPEIAKQKAGIIHKHNHALMFKQADNITDVFCRWTEYVQAELDIIDPAELLINEDIVFELKKLPEFQQRNWNLAHHAFSYIQSRDKDLALNDDDLIKTMSTIVPARMDTIRVEDKTIIMDGAHNQQKMQAFVSSFQEKYHGKKAVIMLSLKEDKQFREVLPLLLPITSTLIVTSFKASQDLPSVGISPELIGDAAKKLGFKNVIIESDSFSAYTILKSQPSDTAIITGSFYLICQLRQALGELKNA